jgi:hypothetical protein
MSHIFEPETQKEQQEQETSKPYSLYPEQRAMIRIFLDKFDISDCAGLSGQQSEKTVYENYGGQGQKKKGGRPPKDYTAVEVYVDLQLAVDRLDWLEAVKCYHKLIRLLGMEA